MADFDALESGVEASEPIELYEFGLGTDVFRYTSSEDIITFQSETYDPIGIGRDAIAQGQGERRRVLEITLPASNEFAQKYVNVVPGNKASMTVIRLQRNESPTFATPVVIFKGRVKSVGFPDDGLTARVAAQSIEEASSRTIPRFTYMAQCNHVLYDKGCQVPSANFNHIGNVSVESGLDITVDGLAASGFDMTGGLCQNLVESDFRLVVAQSGDVITLLIPFATSPLSGNVQVFAGCDHIVTSDCALVFDNVLEFGGFAFVPNRNIFESGLV